MVGVSERNKSYAGIIFITNNACPFNTIIGSGVDVMYDSNGVAIVSCGKYTNLIVLSGSPCTIENID